MRNLLLLKTAFVITCLSIPSAWTGGFRAGLARVDITPELPFWLTGYASRSAPATNVAQRIYAKAIALDDGAGEQAVIVTADLIGIPAAICESAAERIRRITGLSRSKVLFNASHTHAGPMIWSNLQVMFDFTPSDEAKAKAYAAALVVHLSDVATEAVARLEPSEIAFGQGSVGFATNRREFTRDGVRLGVNPSGAMDHSVPVLRVTTPKGKLKGIVFGYACHNTTLGGGCYSVHGDYAGEAQRALELARPEATAMFLMLCGGDQNPHPRGTFDHAASHGRALASEVEHILDGWMRELVPPIRTGFQTIEVPFAPHSREQFEEEAKSKDIFQRRRAQAMLAAYDSEKPVRNLDYPIQVIRLGSDFTLLGLAGEVVVDYALKAKRAFSQGDLVVAGYCNDVPCYISTTRITREGGYEPDRSMIYYGQPGPLGERAEASIFEGIHDLLSRVAVER